MKLAYYIYGIAPNLLVAHIVTFAVTVLSCICCALVQTGLFSVMYIVAPHIVAAISDRQRKLPFILCVLCLVMMNFVFTWWVVWT